MTRQGLAATWHGVLGRQLGRERLGKARRSSEAGELVQAAEASQPGGEGKASDSHGGLDRSLPALPWVTADTWGGVSLLSVFLCGFRRLRASPSLHDLRGVSSPPRTFYSLLS